MVAPKIQDYAIIGDGRSAALVSNRGSIDWFCWPRFDSPSIFGAIVDPNIGGHWSIRPAQDAKVSRRYLDKTNVLETTFARDSAKVILTDFMSVTSEQNKHNRLWPEHELLRLIQCEGGVTEVVFEFNPRLNYGSVVPKLERIGKLGWRFGLGRHLYTLSGDIDLDFKPSGGWLPAVAKLRLNPGDTIRFALNYSKEGPAVLAPLGEPAQERLTLTKDWWRNWANQSTYRGRYERQVTRSALVLKLLSYAPSGAIVAAPTTSLPERIGGDLNWDYRFAWLRDASFTVGALFGLGYKDDAKAFVDWLLHATRLTRPELRVVYDVFGEGPPSERELSRLRGHSDSSPVRIGNAAIEQVQLDVYGEVVDAVFRLVRKDQKLDRETRKVLRQCAQYVCDHWHEADHGMWEERDQRRHYTHSRLMCWVALDRVLQMQARGQLRGLSVDKCEHERQRIREEIETRAWNSRLRAYARTCDGEDVDANAFLLAHHGFEQAAAPRMLQTYDRIREILVPRPGLVHRNQPSKDRHEGAFAICSFWEASFLVQSGNPSKGREIFEATLSYANEVDLFSEEIDPETGDALGNFPQGFTHLGLINAALALDDSDERSGTVGTQS